MAFAIVVESMGRTRHGAQIQLHSPNAYYACNLAPVVKGLQVSPLGWHLRRHLAQADTYPSLTETATRSHPFCVDGPPELYISVSSTPITIDLRYTCRRLATIGRESSVNPVNGLWRERLFGLTELIAEKLPMALKP
jgi:hypothetical protein